MAGVCTQEASSSRSAHVLSSQKLVDHVPNLKLTPVTELIFIFLFSTHTNCVVFIKLVCICILMWCAQFFMQQLQIIGLQYILCTHLWLVIHLIDCTRGSQGLGGAISWSHTPLTTL